jgi:dihydrodipicolinate synthase/N-acetylneuraminate lyase
MKIQGIFAAIATPFDYNGAIYKAKVQHNVEKWNKVGLAGYAVATRIGEGGLLTFDERVELWKLVKQAAAPDRILIADVTREGTRESVLLAERAAEAGFHAVLCKTPFVVDSSPVPVLTDDLTPADNLWTALKGGAQYAILGFASAAPYACIAIWEAFRTREEEAGLDWQARIAHPAALVSEAASLKHAMDLNGYYGGPPRLPLAPPNRQRRLEIEEAFRDIRG